MNRFTALFLQVIPSPSTPAFITLTLLLIIAGFLIPGFLLPERLLALGQQVAPLFLVTIGQTFVVLVGGLDISVGAVLTISLVVASGVMQGNEQMTIPGVIACLAIGTFVGCVNGLLVQLLRLPPLITTIGIMSILQGVAWVYTNGAPGGSVPNSIRYLANGKIGIMPVADIVILVVFIIVIFLTQKTIYGRYLYAVGANQRAAQLSGIPINRIMITAYIFSSLMAAGGGLMLAGYVGVGTLEAGDPYVLNSIAAVIIGGTKFTGGEGSFWGSAFGVFILASLTALLIQLGIPVALRSVLLSLIVVAAAIFQTQKIGR
ncbi:MAG: ABC transporter permease [Thermosphaera sp.]